MPAHGADGENRVVERFDYFVVRLARSTLEHGRLSGVIERLSSGDKRRFESAEEMERLLSDWAALEANIRPGITRGNGD